VAPEHKHAVVVVEDDSDRCSWHANDVVLEAFTAGGLDICEDDLDPSALVEGALSVHLPAHALVVDHGPIMADATPSQR
jgi:hypothetical protein